MKFLNSVLVDCVKVDRKVKGGEFDVGLNDFISKGKWFNCVFVLIFNSFVFV